MLKLWFAFALSETKQRDVEPDNRSLPTELSERHHTESADNHNVTTLCLTKMFLAMCEAFETEHRTNVTWTRSKALENLIFYELQHLPLLKEALPAGERSPVFPNGFYCPRALAKVEPFHCGRWHSVPLCCRHQRFILREMSQRSWARVAAPGVRSDVDARTRRCVENTRGDHKTSAFPFLWTA